MSITLWNLMLWIRDIAVNSWFLKETDSVNSVRAEIYNSISWIITLKVTEQKYWKIDLTKNYEIDTETELNIQTLWMLYENVDSHLIHWIIKSIINKFLNWNEKEIFYSFYNIYCVHWNEDVKLKINENLKLYKTLNSSSFTYRLIEKILSWKDFIKATTETIKELIWVDLDDENAIKSSNDEIDIFMFDIKTLILSKMKNNSSFFITNTSWKFN